MEETDMVSHCNVLEFCRQPENAVFCAAKAMEPRQRQGLALQALAGSETVSQLAQQHEVFRVCMGKRS